MSEALTRREEAARLIRECDVQGVGAVLDENAALRQEIERLRHQFRDMANERNQAEQDRAMIHRRYADQCASVHRLMQENAGLQARLDALLDHDKGPAVDSPHGD